MILFVNSFFSCMFLLQMRGISRIYKEFQQLNTKEIKIGNQQIDK